MKIRHPLICVGLFLLSWYGPTLPAGESPNKVKWNADGKEILPRKPAVFPTAPATAECENSWSLVASLDWGSVADWDLHLETPNAHIYYGNLTEDGFTLNRDAYRACNSTPIPPEIITGNGQCGTYRVYSNLYSTCAGAPPITFDATVTASKPIRINGVAYNPGETFNPQNGVDFTVGEPCTVQPLAPLTDPVAISFEAGNTIDTGNLNSGMQDAHSCFRQAVIDAGGNFRLNSAYRPPQYQAHLREVWDKWTQLRNNEDQNCQQLRSQVQSEFMRHELLETQRPASPSGRHTHGEAIDVSVNPTVTGLPLDEMLTLANDCDLRRPVAASDPVHFELDGDHMGIALANALPHSVVAPRARQDFKRQMATTTTPPIEVRVSVEDHPSGTARYRYTVSNNSDQAIVGLFIGYDYQHGISELIAAPLGWNLDSGIPPSSIEQPQGWHASLVTTEEVPVLSLQWIANSASFGMDPGTNMSSFSALLDARSNEYASAHWTTVLADGQTISGLITPFVTQLANISTRLRVETGDNVLIGGFIVKGTQAKKIIVRAIGTSLPLVGALADPVLELRNSSGSLVASNDDWRSDQEAEIIATTIPPSEDLESAIVTTLPANNSAYTAIVRGFDDGTGIGVVEAYDLDQTVDSKLANISTRGFVQTGDNVLIAGTIVVGQLSQKVIVRAIGPSLNVPGKMANPTLELRDSNGGLIGSNDDWRSDQEGEIIATTIPPPNNFESAIVAIFSANGASYTAIVRGINNTTGIAVVEVYALD